MKNKIDIEIVLGYKSKVIENILERYGIEFVKNPFYSTTNSLVSFWFLFNKWGDEDVIVMNADVYIEQNTLDLIVADNNSPVLYIDSSDITKGDYFIKHSFDNKLLSYGKDLGINDRTAEYIGLAKIARKDKKEISKKLSKMMEEKQFNCWWEDILYGLSDKGKTIHVNDIKGYFWGEIDTIQDYKKLTDFIKNKKGVRCLESTEGYIKKDNRFNNDN